MKWPSSSYLHWNNHLASLLYKIKLVDTLLITWITNSPPNKKTSDQEQKSEFKKKKSWPALKYFNVLFFSDRSIYILKSHGFFAISSKVKLNFAEIYRNLRLKSKVFPKAWANLNYKMMMSVFFYSDRPHFPERTIFFWSTRPTQFFFSMIQEINNA